MMMRPMTIILIKVLMLMMTAMLIVANCNEINQRKSKATWQKMMTRTMKLVKVIIVIMVLMVLRMMMLIVANCIEINQRKSKATWRSKNAAKHRQ